MVLIMSINEDLKTADIISWLLHYEIPFIRINENTRVKVESFSIKEDVEFSLVIENPHTKDVSIKSSEITGFWYRRGKLNPVYPYVRTNDQEHYNAFASRLNYYLHLESNVITEAIYNYLTKRKSINSFAKSEANKIDYLILAKEVGFDIPNTLIGNNKDSISKFVEQQPTISKSLFVGGWSLPKVSFGAGTNVLTKQKLDELPNSFFHSCIQEQLDKAYELRIFYLHGKCYASAIFSQNDKQTSVDFRYYNKSKPNRTPPYKLPIEVVNKIRDFMSKAELNCGSLDIVVTKDKRYVFLEVNPIGQFTQVSYPCNYYLERTIAQYFKR